MYFQSDMVFGECEHKKYSDVSVGPDCPEQKLAHS